MAQVGDWVIATGSAPRGRAGQLVCAMRVTERLTYDAYWADPRFVLKKPDLTGSRMRAYGDNIYHRDENGDWVQADSHHSLPGGDINPVNLLDDTKTDQVLVSDDFWYFGRDAPLIPVQFRGTGKDNICTVRGHKKNFSPGLEEEFIAWVRQHPNGAIGRPDRWP